MDANTLNIIAAAMARSNMGFDLPPVEDVRMLLRSGSSEIRLADCVTKFCQQFMENDNHWDIFYEEAQGWKKRLEKRTYEQIKETWPNAATMLENARKSSSSG